MGDDNRAVRLPQTYDAVRLREDLQAAERFGFSRHPGPYHDGSWSSLSLYALGGDARNSDAGELWSRGFRPTLVLAMTPYFRQLLDELGCTLRAVRLLALAPGGRIEPHRDVEVGFAFGIARLHIPVVTHPDVELVIDGERYTWNAGELWYGDFTRVHSVNNKSSLTRVHLVMDVEVGRAVERWFPPGFVRSSRRAAPLGRRAAGWVFQKLRGAG